MKNKKRKIDLLVLSDCATPERVGEVKDAGVAAQPEGRPDDATLTLKDLGDKVFYGG